MTLTRMHSIALSLLVGLGIFLFSIADQNLIYILIAVPVIIAARLINEGTRATPLPRWLINVLVVVATIYLAVRWGGNFDDIISVVCQYLVLLQLFKLFEPARPRDQSQMIMLSVMLVIGSTLTSVTAEVGLILLGYLPLLLWSILLHQLVSGQAQLTEHAPPPHRTSLVVGRRPKGDLGWVALGTGVLIVGGAIGVFLAMPRGMAAQGAMLGSWSNPGANSAVTGFTNQVKLGASGLLSESTRVVFEMEIVSGQNATRIGGRRLLRGAVLDFYDRDRGEWRSNVPVQRGAMRMAVGGGGSRSTLDEGDTLGEIPGGNSVLYTQHITMRVPVIRNLFAMWKPQTFRLDSGGRMLINEDRYRGIYSTMISGRHQNLSYSVVSAPHALAPPRRYDFAWLDWESEELQAWAQTFQSTLQRRGSIIKYAPPHILSSARPEIASSRAANPFANTRIQELAERILAERHIDIDHPDRVTYDAAASTFKLYLQDNFLYTTEMIAPAPGQDPIEMFLFDEQLGGRGHCEYFASAMAAMCLSVGIPARVVTGYVASETDGMGRFIVRENHAHAWAEVEIRSSRWQEFDPSPPEAVQRLHTGGSGLASRVRRVFEVFQLAWIRNIVTYDRDTQEETLEGAKDGPLRVLRAANRWVGAQLLDQGELPVDGRPISRFGAAARTFISILMLSTILGAGVFLAVSRGPPAMRRALALLTLSAPPEEPGPPQLRALREHHRKMHRALGKAGLGRGESTPALEHARAIELVHPELGADAAHVIGIYYAVRFGHSVVSDQTIEDVQVRVRQIARSCDDLARGRPARHNGAHAHSNESAAA